MSRTKPNEYWLGKVKLWIALHGGWKGIENVDLCYNCRYLIERDYSTYDSTVRPSWNFRKYDCKRKKEMRGRLMAKKDLSSIKFNPNVNAGDDENSYFCVEWVKDV